jgi:K+-sensing histidine kinase KdpD
MLQRMSMMIDINWYEQKHFDRLSETGNQDFSPTMPLWKVIENCAVEVSESQEFVDKQLTFDLDVNASSILVESVAFETLINQLLDNAARYSPKRGRVRISYKKDGDYSELSVSDEGPGMAAEMMDEIFTQFSRSTRKSSPRVGMGLYLCARVVEAYDGVITCANQKNGGLTVTARFPLRSLQSDEK